jgi:hypothetical protein
MIAAQPRERRPAPRAAVPATLKIPGHLNPGQVRVIPSPRPRPRPALPARRPPASIPAAITARPRHRRPRPPALRRPAEHHPLQDRQVSPQPLQLGSLPRVRLPQPGVLLPHLAQQPRHLPVRLKRRSQHVPQRRLSTLQIRDNARRNRHAAQQTPSAAANHAPPATCPIPPAATAPARHSFLPDRCQVTRRPACAYHRRTRPSRHFRILTHNHRTPATIAAAELIPSNNPGNIASPSHRNNAVTPFGGAIAARAR